MSRNTSRVGRRRRVLNEEVLTGGAGRNSAAAEHVVPGDTPRYGAGANIENHPQVTDFVPRRYRAIAAIILLVVTLGVLAETAAHFAPRVSALTPTLSAAQLTEIFVQRLVAWTSASVLLIAAACTRLIYSLRRHRVDDSRGRYRVWRLASWVAVALSLNAVVGAHVVAAGLLGGVSGWTLLPGQVGWWLLPAAVLGGWLLVKLTIDMAECRGALAAYLLAAICFVAAGMGTAGISPLWLTAWADTLARQLPLAGNLLLLTGSLLAARYIVLDVQGLIHHRADVNRVKTAAPQSSAAAAGPPAETAKPQAESTPWVDGSESEQSEDAGEDRRLSKAERKRLRKQKHQRAA